MDNVNTTGPCLESVQSPGHDAQCRTARRHGPSSYRALQQDADLHILASEIELDNSFRLLQIYNRATDPTNYSYPDGEYNLATIRSVLMETFRHTNFDNLTFTDKEELGIVAVLVIGEVAELKKDRD